MQLAELCKENMVFLDFAAESKDDALNRMVKAVEGAGGVDDINGLRQALIEREKLGTTGVGGGVAIPHARSATIKDLSIAFFRSKSGVQFNAIDNKPVNLVFLLLAPLSAGGPYLKLLAKISRLLRNDDFRSSLQDASSATEIIKTLKEYD